VVALLMRATLVGLTCTNMSIWLATQPLPSMLLAA
jgi:hypothetical protein